MTWPELALLIFAAWFAVSIILGPAVGRWLRACREAAEAQQESPDSGNATRKARRS